jgi:hypothetical protein
MHTRMRANTHARMHTRTETRTHACAHTDRCRRRKRRRTARSAGSPSSTSSSLFWCAAAAPRQKKSPTGRQRCGSNATRRRACNARTCNIDRIAQRVGRGRASQMRGVATAAESSAAPRATMRRQHRPNHSASQAYDGMPSTPAARHACRGPHARQHTPMVRALQLGSGAGVTAAVRCIARDHGRAELRLLAAGPPAPAQPAAACLGACLGAHRTHLHARARTRTCIRSPPQLGPA